MRFIRLVFICLFMASPLLSQDKAQVPPDVNYKAAPDIVNAVAKDALQKAFAGDKTATKQVLMDSLTCGPMLWQSIKSDADKSLVDARKIIAVIGVPTPSPTEGRVFESDAERQNFWRILFKKYPALANGKIRKANAWEISYYWATVPFDIQEPFFAIEAGSDVFIANLRMVDDKPTLFWIDLVSNFQKQASASVANKQ